MNNAIKLLVAIALHFNLIIFIGWLLFFSEQSRIRTIQLRHRQILEITEYLTMIKLWLWSLKVWKCFSILHWYSVKNSLKLILLNILVAGVELTVELSGKAQKYIKWAGSSLNYDDVPTAILNLRKALHLLTTGEDPAWKYSRSIAMLLFTRTILNHKINICFTCL